MAPLVKQPPEKHGRLGPARCFAHDLRRSGGGRARHSRSSLPTGQVMVGHQGRAGAAAASPAVRLSKLGGSTMRWFVVTGSLQREIALLARAGARRDEACEWLGTVR